MRILIAVHNLIVEKSYLMPWRTVCDVVKCMREDGHEWLRLEAIGRVLLMSGSAGSAEARDETVRAVTAAIGIVGA